MKEEDVIKQKIDSLSDFDLSFNTRKGWETLSQKRKTPTKRFWPLLSRVAVALTVFGALWLIVSKLTYLPKIDVSSNKQDSIKSSKTPISPLTNLKPEAKLLKVNRYKPAALKVKDETKRIIIEAEPIVVSASPSIVVVPVLKPDSIKMPFSDQNKINDAVKVVHINEINQEYIHPSSKKQRTFYVKIGSESIEIPKDQKPRTFSYIIR